MDWSKGFSSSYYMTLVDPITWRDTERIEIISGKISRKEDGLRESADVECEDFNPDREHWIRIYLVASQKDDVERVPLFTGLASVPESNINGMQVRYPLTCYSVLKPAEDVLLQKGWYTTLTNGADVVADLLSVTSAPVVVAENAPKLSQYIIAEDGDTNLSMVNKVLDAINWRLRISGDGSIEICPMASEVLRIFGQDNDVIEPQLTRKADWFDCPNVFRATNDNQTAVARDDSDDSLLSTATRGREIWREESVSTLNSGESLKEYAQRRLNELQSVAYSVSYTRRFDPNVLVGDLIELHYPAQKLLDRYRVVSQSINLGYGGRTSEEVQK